MEQLHFVHYAVGGEYKVHHDFFHPGTDYYKDSIGRWGQRKKTALIYLNDNFKGGETEFPEVKRTIIPKKNKLVIWDNLKENGELDYASLHAGLPVIEGIKQIVVLWIRENSI
jgi:prolyl 4-hydroxylase